MLVDLIVVGVKGLLEETLALLESVWPGYRGGNTDLQQQENTLEKDSCKYAKQLIVYTDIFFPMFLPTLHICFWGGL